MWGFFAVGLGRGGEGALDVGLGRVRLDVDRGKEVVVVGEVEGEMMVEILGIVVEGG
jgi:hypothetical protein